MRTLHLFLILLCVLIPLTPLHGAADDPAEPSVRPIPRFQKNHARFLERAKQPMDILFIGDSITEFWVMKGHPVPAWQKMGEKYRLANFGASGELVQHVLWRVSNGELDGVTPRMVVLMIGTNSLGAPEDRIVLGIKRIVGLIREKVPAATVVLMGLTPRDHKPEVADAHKAKRISINRQLATLADGKTIQFLDLSEQLAPGGVLDESAFTDKLHLSPKGYDIWAEALAPIIAKVFAAAP